MLHRETSRGGDIMRVENHFYIGLTKRTNLEGTKQLSTILEKYGYTSSNVSVNDILHLKTGIAYLENNNFIAVQEMAHIAQNSKVIILDEDE